MPLSGRRTIRFRALCTATGRPRKGPWRNDPIEAWQDALDLSEDARVQEVELGSPVRIKYLTNPFVAATVCA